MLNQLLITFNLLGVLALAGILWHEWTTRRKLIDMIMKEINKLSKKID